MNTFYIVRHGQTENNKAQRFSGWIDTPLTELGVEHALATAAKLQGIHFDKVISSDLGRAFATAYSITRQVGYTGEIIRTQGLREANYGDYGNRPYAEGPMVDPSQYANFVYPNGESLMQMQTRVLACLRDIDIEYQAQTILLVGHDGTINAIRENFTHETMSTADTVSNAHDSAWRFTVADGHVASFEEYTGATTAAAGTSLGAPNVH